MFVTMELVSVPMPFHAHIFVKNCMLFAAIDVFDGRDLYNEVLFDFYQTPPISHYFGFFGYET